VTFSPDGLNPNASFRTHFWRDDADEDGVESYYTSEEEAHREFQKVEAGKNFSWGAIYKWSDKERDWVCLDNWPEDFDGVNFANEEEG
jgi:hypothetical protein